MKTYLTSLVTVRSLCALLGALLLSVVIWFFAPLLLGDAKLWLLVLLMALPPLVWLSTILLLARRACKRDAALVKGVTQDDAQSASEAAAAAASEQEQIAQRLGEALASVKGSALYDQPWYVMIGPPGSGKTTALRNAGLEFQVALPGAQGTRYCEWSISEHAVLIDTAGRYTTQDADAPTDRAGWERFLELLRRERPRQPLNGIIVCVGADTLSVLDANERESHAQAVRRRVLELDHKLGQRLPVYLLVSKADLIIGFTEFFDDLDREGRAQVWGMTFEAEQSDTGAVSKFADAFGGLSRRLLDRIIERLHNERGPEQRVRIAGFPAQFASLEATLQSFVHSAFGGSKRERAPFLRGVYFTSGTQEGTPIDRLTGALARTFGIDASRPAAVMGQKGRSYFLSRLLKDVVFNEARLAARDREHERRRRLSLWSSAAASVLLLIGGVVWGWIALSNESARQQQVVAAIDKAEAAAKLQSLDRVSATSNPAGPLSLLDAVRELSPAAQGSSALLGLSQKPKLQASAEVAYTRALERVMLPRLMARLEGQMRAGMQKPQYLYVATRVYLMLGREGPMDAALVSDWMRDDWARAFPGVTAAPVREALAMHLDALLTRPFAKNEVDGALVDAARRIFSNLPLSERIYARLRTTPTNAAAWKPADPLGLAGQKLFALTSGRPLEEASVPGLFTVEGFYQSVLPQLPKAIQDGAAESWVLGPRGAAQAGDPQQLESAVLQLYAKEYIAEWQKMLNSLTLAPFGSPTMTADALSVLSAANSPMRDLLVSIAKQLSPGTPPPATPGAGGNLTAKALSAASAASSSAARTGAGLAAQTLGLAPPPNAATVVAQAVESQFKGLREASGKSLDDTLIILGNLQREVASAANTAAGSSAPVAANTMAAQQVDALARRTPEPLSRWLTLMKGSTSGVITGGARAAIAAAGAQALAPFCRNVESRFPFNREPNAPDMPMDDFLRLFSPGGAFEVFLAQNLSNLIDTRSTPWRPVVVDGQSPISAFDIAQFQNAAAITKAFFPPPVPGRAGGLGFDVVPVAVEGAASAVLEIDGVKNPIAAAGRAIALQWPSRGAVALSFAGDTPQQALVSEGPWAALRFVLRGRLQPGPVPDRMRLSLQSGTRIAEFELRTGSIVHPFGLRELAAFRCPQLRSQ